MIVTFIFILSQFIDLVTGSLCKRIHMVDGAYLTVKKIVKTKPRPRPIKKQCLFLSGIPDGCSTEHLSLFIERQSGMNEPLIRYGEIPGTAICTFSEEIPGMLLGDLKKYP